MSIGSTPFQGCGQKNPQPSSFGSATDRPSTVRVSFRMPDQVRNDDASFNLPSNRLPHLHPMHQPPPLLIDHLLNVVALLFGQVLEAALQVEVIRHRALGRVHRQGVSGAVLDLVEREHPRFDRVARLEDRIPLQPCKGDELVRCDTQPQD